METIPLNKKEIKLIKRLSMLYQKIEAIDNHQGKDIYVGLTESEQIEYDDLKTLVQGLLPIDRS